MARLFMLMDCYSGELLTMTVYQVSLSAQFHQKVVHSINCFVLTSTGRHGIIVRI